MLIRTMNDGIQQDWHRVICHAELAYNTTRQSSTGYTPAEVVYGQKLQIPLAFCLETSNAIAVSENMSEYMQKRMVKQAEMWRQG